MPKFFEPGLQGKSSPGYIAIIPTTVTKEDGSFSSWIPKPEQPLVAIGPDSTDLLNPAKLPEILPEGLTRRDSLSPDQYDQHVLGQMVDEATGLLSELHDNAEVDKYTSKMLSEVMVVLQNIENILHVPAKTVLATPLGAVQRFTKGMKWLQDKLQGDLDRYEGKE